MAAEPCSAEPVWSGLIAAGDSVRIPEFAVLHAGPPYRDLAEVPVPVRNSALIAAIYEGWADDLEGAGELLRRGDLRFFPSADFGVSIPLAAVVSSKMWLQVIQDSRQPERQWLAPINGGMTDDLRFGVANLSTLGRLRLINDVVGPELQSMLSDPMELIPVADEALSLGDDCHGRTNIATNLLVAELRRRKACSSTLDRFLEQATTFFLNLWIAASRLLLFPPRDLLDDTQVINMAGNGVRFGIQTARLPEAWRTVAASPPVLASDIPTALGAIGDSPAIEAFGLGGMLRFGSVKRIALGLHPKFTRAPVHTCLSATQIVATRISPVCDLGIIDKKGQGGLMGRGIYRPPIDLFDVAQTVRCPPTNEEVE